MSWFIWLHWTAFWVNRYAVHRCWTRTYRWDACFCCGYWFQRVCRSGDLQLTAGRYSQIYRLPSTSRTRTRQLSATTLFTASGCSPRIGRGRGTTLYDSLIFNHFVCDGRGLLEPVSHLEVARLCVVSRWSCSVCTVAGGSCERRPELDMSSSRREIEESDPVGPGDNTEITEY